MEISVQKMSEAYAGSSKNTVERTHHHISDLAALNQILDERKAYLRLLQARRELEAIRREIDAISNTKEKMRMLRIREKIRRRRKIEKSVHQGC